MLYAGRRSGFTVLEMLVVCALLGIILTLALRTLLPTMSASRKAAERVDVHQRATLLGERLAGDLRASTRAGVGIYTDGGGQLVSVHRRKATTDTPWEQSLRVYRWKNERMVGQVVDLPDIALVPMVPSTPPVESDKVREFLRVDGVKEFDFVLTSGPAVTFTVRIEQGRENQTLVRTVFMRNSDD